MSSGAAVFFTILFIGLILVISLKARRREDGEGRRTERIGEAPPRRRQRLARTIPPPDKAMARLRMEYADAFGVLTERQISIIQLDATKDAEGRYHPSKMRAYCHLRRGYRTFMVRRIQKLYVPSQEEPLRFRGEIHHYFADLCARVATSPGTIVAPQ
jgi:hypothetical protein